MMPIKNNYYLKSDYERIASESSKQMSLKYKLNNLEVTPQVWNKNKEN